MAEETPTTAQAEEIKTTADLMIEKLTARLDALEARNSELQDANRGLWAQLHPVQTEPAPEPAPAVPEGPTDAEIVLKNLIREV